MTLLGGYSYDGVSAGIWVLHRGPKSGGSKLVKVKEFFWMLAATDNFLYLKVSLKLMLWSHMPVCYYKFDITHESVFSSPSLLNEYLRYDKLWGPSQRVVTLFCWGDFSCLSTFLFLFIVADWIGCEEVSDPGSEKEYFSSLHIKYFHCFFLFLSSRADTGGRGGQRSFILWPRALRARHHLPLQIQKHSYRNTQ